MADLNVFLLLGRRSRSALRARLASPEGSAQARSARADGGSGDTALIRAVSLGDLALAKLPVPHGDPEAKDAEGFSALTISALDCRPDLVQALLVASEAKSADPQGHTVLMAACMRSGADPAGSFECAKICSPPATPLACDCRGHTALMIAADLGNAPLVDLLLPVSDAAAISNEGLDAAFLARVAGMAPTCNLILAHDAGVEAAAMRSSTPPADERADASKPKRPRV